MSTLAELEAELAQLKAGRSSSGTTEIRFGDRWVRRDLSAQDARIDQLEKQVQRMRAAQCRRPIRVSF
jgi:thymidylate synthase